MKKPTRVTKLEYESESLNVIANSWIEYRAQALDLQSWDNAFNNPEPPYHQRRIYYTDRRSIHTIKNAHNDEIVTCFHEHFGGRHQSAVSSISGQVALMLKYIDHLIKRQKSGQLKNLRIEKTATGLPSPIRLAIKELGA